MEAGISLTGTEVKSIRGGRLNFADSYGLVDNGELFLVGLDIQPYAYGNIFNHEAKRRRRLLMHGHEIRKLKAETAQKGMALVPLSVYFNDKGKIKVEIGLGRGKKLFDRRDDMDRAEARRMIKNAMGREK